MKTEIKSHTFKGLNKGDGWESYTYEITFNKSLEHTARMEAMCRGLDKYDRWKGFWLFVHNIIAHPLLVTNAKWAYKFHDWTANKF